MRLKRTSRTAIVGAMTATAVVAVAAAVSGAGATTATGPAPTDLGHPVWNSTYWNGPGTPVRLTDVAKTINARGGAATGLTGKGIGVALIDTGVVDTKALPAARLINGPDLSVESQATNLRYLDTYGHGSHMAGIIAGETLAYGFQGIAYGATLYSIKVGTSRGVTDVSQVAAAVDWVVAHRNDNAAAPIRVINLSYGTDSTQGGADPLNLAVENAWKAGVVVVVAGGNDGNSVGRLTTPAADPYVISVGSAVTYDTLDQTDDTVSNFTSLSSGRNIDLVAPGESIESIRVPGSYLDLTYPNARTQYDNFKGSGTSQAAAVVSGAVALLLEKRPTLKPDQVKKLLVSTGVALPKSSNLKEINVAAAVAAATPTTTQTWTRATGTGTWEKARGGSHVVRGSSVLTGEKDLFGTLATTTWANASNTATSWKGGVWMGRRMAGDGWTGTSWASRTWATATWPVGSWGDANWSDGDWNGRFWSGTSWAGGDWRARFWSSDNWSSATW